MPSPYRETRFAKIAAAIAGSPRKLPKGGTPIMTKPAPPSLQDPLDQTLKKRAKTIGPKPPRFDVAAARG